MLLAAAAVVVAAAAIAAAIIVAATAIAAAAEQDQQDDDPAPVTATKTAITHTKYLHEKILRGFRRSFQDIPTGKKCAA